METEGYWPILTKGSIKREIIGLQHNTIQARKRLHSLDQQLQHIEMARKRLHSLDQQLQRIENRLEELINGMESGT